MAEETTLIRDVFNERTVAGLAQRIQEYDTSFKAKQFVKAATANFPNLSYTQRADAITDALEQYLPEDYTQAVSLLVATLPPEGENARVTKFQSFLVVPMTRYISRNGLEHFDLSMQALYEMTKRFTAEWDIRAFIERYPEKSLALLHSWINDPNQHVRRLVSEGTRPRLPWGSHLKGFIKDPAPVLELLDKLRDDEELYVRRSVANNLNDIAKDHPDLVVKTLKRWQKDASEGTRWIIKHASRTLVKQGHPEALELLGYDPKAKVSMAKLKASVKVVFGEHLEFGFDITSADKRTHHLVVDYAVHFKKANGQLAPKVFKLKTLKLKPGETVSITKRHALKPISTRTYYAGIQELCILVNGQELSRIPFELEM